jgi:cholesterol 7alpha-monooxygenase
MLAAILASTGLVLAGAWWSAREQFNGRRRPGEPPLIRGVLPGLGVAPAFGRDAMALLARLRERHGDVFTLFVAGQRMTFVLDPLDYGEVLKTEQLRFEPLVDDVMAKGFGYPNLRELATLEQLEHASRSLLKGEHLSPLAERMQQRLGARLLEFEDDEWRTVDLYAFIWALMFAAGTDTVFGEGLSDAAAAEAFAAFDRAFPLLLAGMPRFMVAAGSDGLARLAVRFANSGADQSEWVARRHELLAELDPDRRGRLQVAALWAANANTIPASFWALAQLLRAPAALQAVRTELDTIAGSPPPALSLEVLDRLPLLDSAVREALRLSSGSLTLRIATQSFVLRTRSGAFWLREGDRVCLAPYLTHHDPEIFEAPEHYRFDRFHSPKGVKQFCKRGEQVRFALMPFGAGRSMCPGRFFALAEIQLLVAMMLSRFEIELLGTWPDIDRSRVGLGIFPPKTELRVRLRRRVGISG